MLIFHKKSLTIYPDKHYPLFGSNNLISYLTIPDHSALYNHVFNLFKAYDNKKIIFDSHLFDVIGPMLQDPKAFSVYLMIHRLSEHEIYIGTIEDLMSKMKLNRSDILSSISLLEEYLLIKVNGINLLKIEINANWF